jgi:hypothetical protein
MALAVPDANNCPFDTVMLVTVGITLTWFNFGAAFNSGIPRAAQRTTIPDISAPLADRLFLIEFIIAPSFPFGGFSMNGC